MEQKRKEEIRKSIIACDNDIVKLRSQAENLEEIILIAFTLKTFLRALLIFYDFFKIFSL